MTRRDDATANTGSNAVYGRLPAKAFPGCSPSEVLHEVKFAVCAGCLDGEGDECHTPGCVFIWHDTPSFPGYPGETLRRLIAGQGYVDGTPVPPPEAP